MFRVISAALAATSLAVATAVVVGSSAPTPAVGAVHVLPPHHQEQASFDGLNFTIAVYAANVKAHDDAVLAEIARAVAASEAREKSRSISDQSGRDSSSGTTLNNSLTGSCESMKPPGFPDWIIQRESRGDPNARNASGAYGCAQLMPGTGGSGSYAERWARTWAGGAGACNWNPPNYCRGR